MHLDEVQLYMVWCSLFLYAAVEPCWLHANLMLGMVVLHGVLASSVLPLFVVPPLNPT